MSRISAVSHFVRRALALCLIALLIVQLILPVQGVRAQHPIPDLVVNSLDGDRDGSCDSAPGDCTLLDAVEASASGGSIGFAFALSGTINLDFSIQTGAKTLTIYGSPTVQVSGQNTVQVFFLINANLTLDGLTIQDGHDPYYNLGGAIYSENSTLTLTNSTIKDSSADDSGGAIYIFTGTVNVTDSTFSRNSATSTIGAGGGIYNYGGTLKVKDSTFENNTTVGYGGGIVNDQGSLSVTNSTFKGNTAVQSGGGVVVNGGSLSVTGTTFENNSGTWGGGIDIWGGQVTVANSTFIGNKATTDKGGAIDGGNDLITVTNSTFTGNSAWSGGAIYSPSALSLKNSTFWGNKASTDLYAGGADIHNDGNLSFANNILANDNGGGDCVSDPVFGLISTNTNNLVEDGSCPDGGVGFKTGDPGLADLADNGGPTQTMALLPASQAINAGDDASCVATDQRGAPRPYGAHCDRGAYEFQGNYCTVANTNDSGTDSLRAKVGNAACPLVDFAPGLSGLTIRLAATIEINRDVTIDGSALASQVIISGDTNNDGTGDLGVFYVYSGVTVALHSLTVTKGNASLGGGINNLGKLTVTGSTFEYNTASTSGGGIENDGTLIVTNTTFQNNSANSGGGIDNNDGTATVTNSILQGNSADNEGGGIDNYGTLTVANSTLQGNSAGGVGGGISNVDFLTLTNSTLTSNSAINFGGGIYNYGILAVERSSLSGNTVVGEGGGIYNDGSTVTIMDSTIAGNSATDPVNSYGGGIASVGSSTVLSSLAVMGSTLTGNTAASWGGGIESFYNNLTVTNSTLQGNSITLPSGGRGGGIYFAAGTLTLKNDTLSGNSATLHGGGLFTDSAISPTGLYIANTIFAGSPSGHDCIIFRGTIYQNLDNLVGDATCLNGGTGFKFGDPKLGPLQNNGGPTQTVALLSGSPAINAGDDATCAAAPVNNLDQRGVTRPKGLHCDIGAFEYIEPTEVSLVSFTAQVEKKPSTGNGKSVLLSWETASEVDNLGFNLYRAASMDGVRTKLNAMLIPTLVPPGSLFGATYTYKDTGRIDGKTYYYWLEAVDIHGGKELTGPLAVKLVAGKIR